MINDVVVPTPKRFNKNSEIERIALDFNKLYRKQSPNKIGYPVDPDFFADCILETSIVWEIIESPPNTTVFARCFPDNRNESDFVISINEKHRNFFQERPEIFRAVMSHEIGHLVLRHHEKLLAGHTPSLFGEEPEVPYLHSTKCKSSFLSKDEFQALCKMAIGGNRGAHDLILQMNNKFEEEWMFWQAEHFAMCFLIPQDRVFEVFESDYNFTNWRGIYQLGSDFGVSGAMMAQRLKKIGAIEIDDKTISLGPLFKQKRLI